MTTPLVSVIMPAYNASRFLGEAVQSILDQTVSDLELIIVDDASTDSTLQICQQLSQRDGRIRIHQRTSNGGIAAALNDALEMCRGRYIARMDADDIALPERLRSQLQRLDELPHIALCGTAIEIVDEHGTLLSRPEVIVGHEHVAAALRYCSPIAHPSWMMRAEVPRVVGGYRSVAPAEDYDFLWRVIRQGWAIDNLPDVGLRYRMSAGSTAARNSLRQRKAFNFVRRLHLNGQELDLQAFKKALECGSVARSLHQLSEGVLQRASRLHARRNPLAYVLIVVAAAMSPHQFQFVWRAARTRQILRRSRNAGTAP
jgi:glycosyltransferase involved in cell wall biosynthesis